MSKRHIPWPSIGQFRDTVKNVQHQARYAGKDENGAAIIDHTRKAPTLTFLGSVKLHGTNASFVSDRDYGYWFQSRSNIITPLDDNAGFAMFGTNNLDTLQSIAATARRLFPLSFVASKDVAIFGEWCGGNIQKGVAISGLPKMFVVFGIALVDDENTKTYLTRGHVKECLSGYTGHDTQIYSIYDFPTY